MTSRIAYNNPDAGGALGLAYHFEMLADRRRLAPLRRAIERVAKGRRVLDSGAGSGVLSILAARAGARVVYAVERDAEVAGFLRQNVGRSGYESVIRILDRDTRSVSLRDIDGEPVDVVLAEHLSTWQVTEPQTSILNHVHRQLASPAAVRIPQLAADYVELVRSQFRFADAVELRTHYFGFSGVARPRPLSVPTLFRESDFQRLNETVIDHGVAVVATRDGVVNSLRLTSPLRVFEDIRFRSSDSLMPPVVVPLREDLEVRTGDIVNVRFRYRCETSWSEVHCEARLDHSRDGAAAILLPARSVAPAAPYVTSSLPSQASAEP